MLNQSSVSDIRKTETLQLSEKQAIRVDTSTRKNTTADGRGQYRIVEESEPATPAEPRAEARRVVKTEDSRGATATPEDGREETNSIMKPKITLNNLDKIYVEQEKEQNPKLKSPIELTWELKVNDNTNEGYKM